MPVPLRNLLRHTLDILLLNSQLAIPNFPTLGIITPKLTPTKNRSEDHIHQPIHITFGKPLISSFYTLLYRLILDGPVAVLGPTCFLERCENLGLRSCEGAEVEVFVYVFVGL